MSSFISVQEHNRMIAELEAEVEQLRRLVTSQGIRLMEDEKDAQRYRWLRDECSDVRFWCDVLPYKSTHHFDAAIDAAMDQSSRS